MKFILEGIKYGFLLALLMLSQKGWCQWSNSAYARYGIGTLLPRGNTQTLGMGSVSSLIPDANSINQINPGSYAFLNNTTFQAGGMGIQSKTSDESGTSELRNGGLHDLAMCFKKRNARWSAVIGLAPVSDAGYNIIQDRAVNDSLNARYRYSGSGGISKFNVGYGRIWRLSWTAASDSIAKKKYTAVLGVGANLSYYFGNIEHFQRVTYSRVNTYGTKLTDQTIVTDVNADLGLNFYLPFHQKKIGSVVATQGGLIGGVVYTPGNQMKSRFNRIQQTTISNNISEVAVDTSLYVSDKKGKITIPSTTTVSIGYLLSNQNQRSFVIGFEMSLQAWSKFDLNNGISSTNPKLNDTKRYSIGIEYTPRTGDKTKNLLDRMTYRMGVRRNNIYANTNGEIIWQEAISAGLSIPILSAKAPGSKFHFGGEFRRSDYLNIGLINDRAFYFFTGLTLTPHFLNQWFIVRKYD